MKREIFEMSGMHLDRSRFINRGDAKWVHPLYREVYPAQGATAGVDLYDSDVPKEAKMELRERVFEQTKGLEDNVFASDEIVEAGEWLEFYQDGCVEEVDAPPVRIVVRTPKNREGKKLPVILFACGGGLLYAYPEMNRGEILELCYKFNAVIVAPQYRTCIDAPYPAAINDMHASWNFIKEHAEELNADADNIVLYGRSAGGQMVLGTAFRLNRYGEQPKGCVAFMPITDDRLLYPSSRIWISDSEWSSVAIQKSSVMWMGKFDAGSPWIGPEGFPNHATVEECRGLCPISITGLELDPDRDYNRELVGKLAEAGVFCNYHYWGGVSHMIATYTDENSIQHNRILWDARDVDIKEFLTYDLRRPWTKAEKD